VDRHVDSRKRYTSDIACASRGSFRNDMAKTKEIRNLCMSEETVEVIVARCRKYAIENKPGPATRREVERHLARYGELRDVIQERTLQDALTALGEEADSEKRKKIWKHFLPILDIMGLGFKRGEPRVHKDWWYDLEFRGGGRLDQGDDFTGLYWNGIPVKETNPVWGDWREGAPCSLYCVPARAIDRCAEALGKCLARILQ
jgi:hypothetical protein